MTVHGRKSLAAFIASCPIIDCHAHPLIPLASQDNEDLVTIVSEASGKAKSAIPSGLPFLRAVNALTGNVKSGKDEGAQLSATERFRSYVAQRARFEEITFTKDALAGIETLLLDDGLRYKTRPHGYQWHSQFVKSPVKRIVRIETLAEDILADRGGDGFITALERAIDDALIDSDVAGFKSAICYRSGLNVATTSDRLSVEKAIRNIALSAVKGDREPVRINEKTVNDFLVNLLASRIARHAAKAGQRAKPIQFHTGLGDNDLRLTLSNPAHLQNYIEAYPDVPILLLHASYPFTKEAGYLASVYANVYLDVGEIFPMVSRVGQETALKEAFALTPVEKLCWSTDGHFYQETYSLATQQIRQVLLSVLSEMVNKEDCSFGEAAIIARQLLFETTNSLYALGLPFIPLVNTRQSNVPSFTPAILIANFLSEHPDVRFVRHSWVDFCGTTRTRVLTRAHLERVLANKENDGRAFATTSHAPFLLQNDAPGIPDFVATGEMGYFPDYTSLYLHPRRSHASVMGDFRLQAEDYHQHCTRTLLQLALHKIHAEGIHDILLGFELEFYLFEQDALQDGRLVPISSAHAWSTSRALQAGGGKALDIIESIITALAESGVDAQQFHAEGGTGQYEIPLGPLPVLQAVDQLIHAKEVITYISATHGYRATFHPKPVPSGAGTGMHMHMSFKPVSVQESFYAGILEELPAICAFSLGGYHSYDRVSDGTWSGGTFCAWGDQNREAALRRVDASKAHWEMKTMDGMANPYLAVAAVLTAARIGVDRKMSLPSQCDVSAAKLTAEDRQALGIKKTLPRTLKEALSNFFSAYGKRTSLVGTLIDPRSRVTEFIQEFGAEPAIRYAQVKEQEAALVKAQEPTKKDNMTVEQASIKGRIFFIERY